MSSLFGRSSPASNTTLSRNAVSPSGELSKDITLVSPPDDSISDLAWSPKADFLAVASWDSKVRIYDVTHKPAGEGVAVINFDGPVLGCAWSKVWRTSCPLRSDNSNRILPPQNGQKAAGSSSDKSVKLLDLGMNGAPAQKVAEHDAPIRSLGFFEFPSTSTLMLVTGSWDKTVKYWDLRQSAPAAILPCQDVSE